MNPKKTIREWLSENHGSFPSKYEKARACSKDLGVSYETVLNKISKFRRDFDASHPVAPEASEIETISVTELLSQHDVAGKAVAIVKHIQAGHLMTDDALRRTLGVSSDRWSRAKKSAALAGYWAMLPDRKVVWGKHETISSVVAQLRELL